ncbi:Ff.00g085920.m01.CDS01 [Fusarium sp. VM40]|nr:Ff.00g085920.m01.CDS01 [Fusarium sp. VM40]
MRSVKVSLKERAKRWSRRLSRTGDSNSDKGQTALDTNPPELSSVIRNSTSLADAALLDSQQTSVERTSSTPQDEAFLCQVGLPTKAASCLSTGLKEVDIITQKKDPWEQGLSLLSAEDQKLVEDINERGDEKTVFAELQKAVIEKQQTSQEKAWKITFGGRSIALRDVAAKMVTWLNSYTQIGDLIAQSYPLHAGIPWSAIKIVLSVLTADQEQMGLILIGLEQVVRIITRCRIYQMLYLGDAAPVANELGQARTQLFSVMARLYAKVFSFLAYYLRLLDLNTAIRTMKAFSQQGKVSEMLTEIGKYEEQVGTEASLCEKAISRSAFQQIDQKSENNRIQFKEMVSWLDKEMKQLWKQLNEDERCKILQWVSDIPYESDHYTASKGRVSGTGEWLLRHNAYLAWRESDKSTLLWLNGIPGAGKTKLSSRVVDDLLATLPSGIRGNTALAYFYCDRNRADHNEPVAIMRSLVRQLCAPWDNASIESCVEEQYFSKRSRGFASDRLVVEECKQLLTQLLARFRTVYIVVDGLDECNRDTRHILMDFLEELIEEFEHSVKVYIASRTDLDLRKQYHEKSHLEVTANDNQADIEKFVLHKMEESKFFQNRLSPNLRAKILQTFHEKSQGMFQWATLHIGELLQLERNMDIKRYLDGLPSGLEATYDKMYYQIAHQIGSKKDVAFAAFQIVMSSWRPLHPFELAIAVAQHPDHEFILDQDIDIGYILDACQNLLVVTDWPQNRGVRLGDSKWLIGDGYLIQEVEESRVLASTAIWENNFGVQKQSICKFAHLSVQEYLETKHWDSADAQAFMAGICLRTILHVYFEGDLTPGKTLPDKLDQEGQTDLFCVSEFQRTQGIRVFALEETESPAALVAGSAPISVSTRHDLSESPYVKGDPDLVIPEGTGEKFTLVSPSMSLSTAKSPSATREEVGWEDRPEDDACQDTSLFKPPPFDCYIEMVNLHNHDDNRSCLSHVFEPYLESHQGSPLEAWVRYSATGLIRHLGKQEEFSSSVRSGLRDLVDLFLGTPTESTIRYKAWARLVQNRWYSRDINGNGDWLPQESLRTLLRPYKNPALGCVMLGLADLLDTWLKKIDGSYIVPDRKVTDPTSQTLDEGLSEQLWALAEKILEDKIGSETSQ